MRQSLDQVGVFINPLTFCLLCYIEEETERKKWRCREGGGERYGGVWEMMEREREGGRGGGRLGGPYSSTYERVKFLDFI